MTISMADSLDRVRQLAGLLVPIDVLGDHRSPRSRGVLRRLQASTSVSPQYNLDDG